MNRRTILVSIIVMFAVIGFVSLLVSQPQYLLKQFLFLVVFVGLIYALYQFMMKGKLNKKEQQAFLKAARKSKKRMQKKHHSHHSTSSQKRKPLRKRSHAHLTVIEGKKGKKKNRASS
ncbi:ABC-type nickel/cobalt efflux system permease component RcnA [Oikeobacillus pervagus]|uniref:ABC-type nickel/cobalt efflux system permease component RcnA n=1 Tax=Oikeobacillus pervagus TaxID=1325931 RepID=A0AAJ1WFE3_9BACI|nr:SA1362 family protein [Oikeobacillus pervagus]MDQ0213842.1 ABC-type nickel/cobalt efflux system permease component RcnA [Oikeobacillus pervagus]